MRCLLLLLLFILGCIDEVRVGGQLLPFYDQNLITDFINMPVPASTNFQLITLNPFPGCHGDDLCGERENICQNGGTCINNFNQIICNCMQGK